METPEAAARSAALARQRSVPKGRLGSHSPIAAVTGAAFEPRVGAALTRFASMSGRAGPRMPAWIGAPRQPCRQQRGRAGSVRCQHCHACPCAERESGRHSGPRGPVIPCHQSRKPHRRRRRLPGDRNRRAGNGICSRCGRRWRVPCPPPVRTLAATARASPPGPRPWPLTRTARCCREGDRLASPVPR